MSIFCYCDRRGIGEEWERNGSGSQYDNYIITFWIHYFTLICTKYLLNTPKSANKAFLLRKYEYQPEKIIAGRKSDNYFYLSIIIHFASKASKCSVISGSEGLGAKDSTILNSLSIKIKRGIYLICQFTLNPSLSTELNWGTTDSFCFK